MNACLGGLLYIVSKQINPDGAGIDFRPSESDVCRCQILMSQVDSRTQRVKIFLMAV